MKKLYICLIFLLVFNYAFAKRRVSEGEEIVNSLLIAIPLLLIGFIICWFRWWSKPQTGHENTSESTDIIGCGGCLMMLIGGSFLLPLLALVGDVFHIVFCVVFVVCVIIALFSKTIDSFNKSNKAQTITTLPKQKSAAEIKKEEEEKARSKREIQWQNDINDKLSKEALRILYDEYKKDHVLDDVHYIFDEKTWNQESINAFIKGYQWGCWHHYSYLSIEEIKKKFHPIVVLGYLRGLEEIEIWKKYGKFPG